MKLVKKLLNKNVSRPQLLGYGAATFLGLAILLLGLQLYGDIRPIISSEDSFLKKDYIVLTKKVTILKTLGGSISFSEKELKSIEQQPFVSRVAKFTTANFGVYLSVRGFSDMVNFGTDLFFEAVPDDFLDVEAAEWKWSEGDDFIPIIVPRTYLQLYNFGFAQTQNMPPLSEATISSVNMSVKVYGQSGSATYSARIVGFSNKLNTILVPESFLQWANTQFGNGEQQNASRLLVEVKNIADPAIAEYIASKGYEFNDDKLDAGKISYFLRIVLVVVLSIGCIITLLALGLLLLSLSLLVHKNRSKFEILALLGYTPAAVAAPYQRLAIGINLLVFIMAFVSVMVVRSLYIPKLELLSPSGISASFFSVAMLIGCVPVIAICLISSWWIRRQVGAAFKKV